MRRGSTLIELLVVMTILAIVLSVSAVALQPVRRPAPDDELGAEWSDARARAARRAVAVEFTIPESTATRYGVERTLRFLPDGRVLGARGAGVRGMPRAAHGE